MRKWTKEEDQILIEKSSQIKGPELAALLNRTYAAIRLRQSKLEIKSKRFNHNRSFFSDPNIINSYWGGLVAADGWIRQIKGGNYLFLSLQSKDGYLVRKFADDLKYDGIVKDRMAGDHMMSILELCSCSEIVQDLKNHFSIDYRKSLTLQPPRLTELNHKLAYIKGYWDGDGCIRIDEKDRLEVSACGTYEVLSWIQNIFDELVPPQGKLRAVARKRKSGSKSDKNHADYKITGHRAKAIFDKLKNIETPELKRKWDVLSSVPEKYYTRKCYITQREKFIKHSDNQMRLL